MPVTAHWLVPVLLSVTARVAELLSATWPKSTAGGEISSAQWLSIRAVSGTATLGAVASFVSNRSVPERDKGKEASRGANVTTISTLAPGDTNSGEAPFGSEKAGSVSALNAMPEIAHASEPPFSRVTLFVDAPPGGTAPKSSDEGATASTHAGVSRLVRPQPASVHAPTSTSAARPFMVAFSHGATKMKPTNGRLDPMRCSSMLALALALPCAAGSCRHDSTAAARSADDAPVGVALAVVGAGARDHGVRAARRMVVKLDDATPPAGATCSEG